MRRRGAAPELRQGSSLAPTRHAGRADAAARRARQRATEALVAALKLGMGLCQGPDALVHDELARGALQEMLPSCRAAPMPINGVHASARLLPARVRETLAALDTLRQRHARP